MKTRYLLPVIVMMGLMAGCANLIVTPPYLAAGPDVPKEKLARLVVHDDKDAVPPQLPYEWISASYAVITRFDDHDLGKRGAVLGSAITGDYEFPKEADFAPGHHTYTIGVMTGCGLLELDGELDASAGTTYDVYGIFKSSYAMSNGALGGCQARIPMYPRKPDDGDAK